VPTETPVLLDRHDKPYPTLDPTLTNPRHDRRTLAVAALAAAFLVSTQAANASSAAYKSAHP